VKPAFSIERIHHQKFRNFMNLSSTKATPNPSLKRSANGMSRWPSSAGPSAHFALAIQRAMPPSPA